MEHEQNNCDCKKEFQTYKNQSDEYKSNECEQSESEKCINRRLFKIANLMKILPAKLDGCAEKLETKGNCWEIITELHQVKHHIQEIKRELSDEPHFMHVFHDDIEKGCEK